MRINIMGKSLDYIKREQALCNYACGRYYYVEYKRNGIEFNVKGLLEHYYSGNVVLLSENGIYHIKHKDIIFMKPIKKMSLLDTFDDRYKKNT